MKKAIQWIYNRFSRRTAIALIIAYIIFEIVCFVLFVWFWQAWFYGE